MDKETLIKVVAMLDARIAEKVGVIMDNDMDDERDNKWEDGYNLGYVDALKHLAITLESAIDADVA
jgi:hypothetical protein